MESEYIETRAVLVSICRDGETDAAEESLAELERLLDTAGGVAVARMIQNKDKPDPRTLIGSGKVEELSSLCANAEIELVVFDEELSPSQIRNLEDALGERVRVIDRSMLILDIFALHAVSREGKLQVELAQLKYTAPRLSGHGREMSRLGGGIGTRGPGESQLETDRRHLHRRISALESELEELSRNRATMRASRDRSGIPKIAIVGYTNAGKSTLLNRLCDAGILAEDKLFATLDPTTRKFTLPTGEHVLLTDTVGFIRKLPHHLVHAFKSTLDEAVYADALMIVIDVSDPSHAQQLEVTEEILTELGAGDTPRIYVLNKCDLGAAALPSVGTPAAHERTVLISAVTGQGVELLLEAIRETVLSGKRRVCFLLPNSEGRALNTLYTMATVEDVEYTAEGMRVTAVVDARVYGMLGKYEVKSEE